MNPYPDDDDYSPRNAGDWLAFILGTLVVGGFLVAFLLPYLGP